MIQTFADQGTRDIYAGEDTQAARSTLARQLWPVARRKLHWIDAAVNVATLRVPPGNRLEVLRGNRAGQVSIRINDQYRITFRFREGHAYEVQCEDYH